MSLRKVLECGRVNCRFSPFSISLDPTLFHSLASSHHLTMQAFQGLCSIENVENQMVKDLLPAVDAGRITGLRHNNLVK